ncbi:hypothetical protein D1816_00315 [Aquimarina sp. AD10]|uniref:Aspartate kinase n=1 Tax=Aquimarina aggregata TaxID=1642818 RepID=A0A162CVJ3_9FLAO|nr:MULTISPECIES: hypothetical protein [Aquimarina]AXT58855.1 hypothetical protein D1816_00315 [Aquimarina sp. AD10]KZS41699.1 hypothetical protein AWE51_20085 [Aquimarina aggregata]RKM99670.1 hypothetical protein D7033_10900 [Aquimarina sp. AD10]
MKTITDCVHNILRHQPFLEDALSRDIINFSSLAIDLLPQVEKVMRKPVKPGSIVMALRRYNPRTIKNIDNLRNLGDIVVRSGITEYTFLNSNTILTSQTNLLNSVKNEVKAYFTYSSNFQESNILVTSSLKDTVEKHFKNETCISIADNLASMSIALPEDNSKAVGLYFYLFKLLAYEGIPVFEVISTSNYFTLFLEKEHVNKAFLLMNEIKEN